MSSTNDAGPLGADPRLGAEVPGERAAAVKPTRRGPVDRVRGRDLCLGPCRVAELQDLSAERLQGGSKGRAHDSAPSHRRWIEKHRMPLFLWFPSVFYDCWFPKGPIALRISVKT